MAEQEHRSHCTGQRSTGQVGGEPKLSCERLSAGPRAPGDAWEGVWAEVCGKLLFTRAQQQHSAIFTMGSLGGCSGPLYCDED